MENLPAVPGYLPGKKVIDISDLLDVFEAQEGIIEHIIGKTGNGKTYYATLRVWELLMQGNVVYTTWKMILPPVYDERSDFNTVFWKTVFGKKQFYSYNLLENWRWIDIDRPDLVPFIASLTDCYVFLDEGQDVFSSHDRIDKTARKAITRTRHMRKTLVIVSQRAQAVDTNARANVTYYFKCVKRVAWFWPFRPYFFVFVTEDMDDNNIPVWEEHIPYSNGKVWRAPIHRKYFASKKIYALYNSWYLREGIEKSQEVNFDAYELSFIEKLMALKIAVTKKPLITPSKSSKEVSPGLKDLHRPNPIDTRNMVQSIYEEAERTRQAEEDPYRSGGIEVGSLDTESGKGTGPQETEVSSQDTLVKIPVTYEQIQEDNNASVRNTEQ